MEAPAQPQSRRVEGLIVALAMWVIVLVSVALFFKSSWGVPVLASDRGDLDRLFYIILAVTGVAYVAVQFLLGYFAWRYSEREGARASYLNESHALEVTWTLGTALILTVLVFMGLRLWNRVFAPPPPDAYVVEVVGAQFQWDMRYPGPDGTFGRVRPELISIENLLGLDRSDPAAVDDFVITNQLVLPVGRPAVIRLRSKDMQHSFFLPHFRVKQDLVPGMTIDTWFVPTQTGEYEIACAELCGLGHYRMRGFLRVVTAEEFQQWLSQQGQ